MFRNIGYMVETELKRALERGEKISIERFSTVLHSIDDEFENIDLITISIVNGSLIARIMLVDSIKIIITCSKDSSDIVEVALVEGEDTSYDIISCGDLRRMLR